MNHNIKSPFDHPQQSQYTAQNYDGLCLVTDRYGHVKHAYSGVSFATVFNNIGTVVNGEGGGIFQ